MKRERRETGNVRERKGNRKGKEIRERRSKNKEEGTGNGKG